MANQRGWTILEHFMIIRTTHTYFLSTDYVPGIVLGAGDIVVNKSDENPCHTEELHVLMGEIKSERWKARTVVL